MKNSDDKNTITSLPVKQEIRQPPVNHEAERALLGAILSNNKALRG